MYKTAAWKSSSDHRSQNGPDLLVGASTHPSSMPYAEVEKVIQILLWLRAERRFRVVWRGFPRARATLEPAENLMPPGCAPRPFAYFASLTTWCGQAGLHSCDAARADGGWSARPARRRGRPQHEGPAQAAHAAEGEEEVVALSKFMCARHACGAAGRRPPCSARSAQLPKPCTMYSAGTI